MIYSTIKLRWKKIFKSIMIEALIVAGKKEQARKVLDDYWGGMVDAGADTFYELYNPENPSESPYGGKAVLSFCHTG